MSTDNYKQVLFNDGEGVVYSDINDSQRFLEAKLWEQIIHNHIGSISIASAARDPDYGGQDGTDHPTSRAYCLNPGSAYLRQGSANHKIQLSPGTLLQKLAVLTGDDPQLVSYTFAGTEEWTLTNGDATNPRVDLLQMKLEWVTADVQSRDFQDATTHVVTTTSMSKKRRVQCTLSVKVGTPAASPTIPEPDAGFVPVGSVVVGETWVIAGNAPIFGFDTISLGNVVVHDQRMPVGVKAYWMDPTSYRLVTAWSLSASKDTVASTNSTNDLQVMCPAGLGRLVGIGVHHTTTPINGQTLCQGVAGLIPNTLARINLAQIASSGLDVTPFFTFEATQAPVVGPTIQQSATTKIGAPLWTNGRRSPYEAMRLGGTVPSDRLVLRIQSGANGSIIGNIVFYIAEGL